MWVGGQFIVHSEIIHKIKIGSTLTALHAVT